MFKFNQPFPPSLTPSERANVAACAFRTDFPVEYNVKAQYVRVAKIAKWFAVASLLVGILFQITIGPILAVIGLVLGIIARIHVKCGNALAAILLSVCALCIYGTVYAITYFTFHLMMAGV